MIAIKLTKPVRRAHKASRGKEDWAGMMRAATGRARLGMIVLATALGTGCVTVNAPNEPIVIELNINITQEVIYRLAADARNTIEENSDLF